MLKAGDCSTIDKLWNSSTICGTAPPKSKSGTGTISGHQSHKQHIVVDRHTKHYFESLFYFYAFSIIQPSVPQFVDPLTGPVPLFGELLHIFFVLDNL